MGLQRSRTLLLLVYLSALLLVGCGGFKGVVTPTLSSISPSTIAAGSAGFTLTANGSNFTGGTKIVWDGVAQQTTVVSNTQLTTTISAAQIASPGTIAISILKSDTTSSNVLKLTITGTGPQGPTLTSISPSTIAAGSASFTLTATGTNFTKGSTITWNGVSISTTTFDSATQLHATISAAQVALPGTVNVGILDSTNTLSNQLPFTITGTGSTAPPTLTSLNPSTVVAGNPGFTLTATGTNFVNASQITWNGAPLTTTFVSATQLTSVISATSLVAAQNVNVAVLNPDSTISNSLTFEISANPDVSPTLTSINPSVVAAGSPAFTMTLVGTNFDNAAVVQSTNSNVTTNLTTTFVSPTQLTAQIPASMLTDIGQYQITVQNPGPRISNPRPLYVGIVTYFGEVKDLVWDPQHQLFYASVPNESTRSPNTVVALTPTGKPTFHPVPGDPDRLAISGDGQYLYVGLDAKGTVQRYSLPSFTPDISVSLGADPNLGPYYALDLQVAPGAPHTIAVSRGIPGTASIYQAQGGVAIYDDAVQRPSVVTPTSQPGVTALLDTIQWGADSTILYAADYENAGGDFYQLAVSPSGVTFVSDHPNYFPPPDLRIHFDTGKLYGDDGAVVDPVSATQLKSFVAGGIMTPDSTLGLAYFLGQPAAQSGTVGYLLQSFNLASTNAIKGIPLYNIQGAPQHMVHWSTTGTSTVNGLAFSTSKIANCAFSPCSTSSGGVYILVGPFITSTAP
ncbi:MAG TPA: hypothetical protein VM554_03405 [Acidisarcina sp.]|nr:hypothetical protein [Acidisarcina sp.]